MTGEEARRFRGSRYWLRISRAYRKEHPLCEACKPQGNLVRSEDVDHIVPLTLGGDLTHDSNLQALCKPCHRYKTGLETGERCKAPNRVDAKGYRNPLWTLWKQMQDVRAFDE